MTSTRFGFQAPRSAQTLEEGLAEYYAANPGLKRDPDLITSEARQFFRAHDVVHVVYGCGTTMQEEAIVKFASLWGTTGGLRVLRGYTHGETLDIYRAVPVGGSLAALLLAPYLIVRTGLRCLRQTRRWPWLEYEPYMDIPLVDIRWHFGIRVAHPQRH